MLLLRADDGVIEVGRKSRPHATWLTAIGFVAMAALPLAGSGPMTLTRWATSLGLLAVAAFLFKVSLRRRLRLTIRTKGSKLVIDTHAVPRKGAELVLGTGQITDGTPRSRYLVCLRCGEGPDLVLLEGRAPDRVMMDLRRICESLKLPVRTGWGLPESATPWQEDAVKRALPEGVLSFQPYQRQRRVGFTVTAGGLGMGVAIWLIASARLDSGRAIAWGSYTLGALTVAAAILVAVSVWTDRRIAALGSSGVDLERYVLGLRVGSTHTAAEGCVGVYRVQSTEGELAHVLLDLGDRMMSVPCAGDEAQSVESDLRGLLTAGE